ncbi:tetratricopeptide repeat protein [Oceanobacillus locisalsi]|uniref:Tetratricopeptide repeat protein n=1 Tax=Oceanobacillus locisalsi TaxID=546107 RepID=A0ABW3NNX9_9BACI
MLKGKKNKTKTNNNVTPFIPEGDFYYTKGVEAFKKRKFDIAIKWIQKAIEAQPSTPLYKCQLSVVYTEIGAYHQANQLLTEVLQTGEYVDCYYLAANNYAHLGLLQDAKKYAQMYLDKKPEGDFSNDAAQLLDFIKMEDEEEENFALEDEDELIILQETAFHHMENEEWETAIPVIEEIMEHFPEQKLAVHDYAQALFYTGKKEEAMHIEEDMLEEEPNNLHSHLNLALFYYETEDPAYEKHIQIINNIYPMLEEQKLRIAEVFARTANYTLAYERYQNVSLEQAKRRASYYKWFSVTAYKTGNPSKALRLWEEGLKRHPKLSEEEGPWALKK